MIAVTAFRMSRGLAASAAIAAAIVAGIAVPFVLTIDLGESRLLFLSLAIVVATGGAYLLRDASSVGVYIGAWLMAQQIIGWTVTSPLSLLIGLTLCTVGIFMFALYPFVLKWREMWRTASFWLGPATFLPGVIAAALHLELTTAAQRLAIAAIPLLGLAVIMRSPERTLRGIAAGSAFGLSVVLLAAAAAPVLLSGRLFGGEAAQVHPNILAWFAAALALTWAFREQIPLRWLFVGAALLVLVLTGGRTAIVATFAGFLIGMPRWYSRLAIVLLAAALLGTIGTQFFSGRQEGVDVLSGRLVIWQQGLDDWASADLIGRFLGPEAGLYSRITLAEGRAFVADNLAIQALVRGGLIAVVEILVALAILMAWVVSAARSRRLHAFYGVAPALIAAGLATSATESSLAGGMAWWWFAAAECVLRRQNQPQEESTRPWPRKVPASARLIS